jgi:hypothetical protein
MPNCGALNLGLMTSATANSFGVTTIHCLTVVPENLKMFFQGRDPEIGGPITACPTGLVS